MASSQSDQQAFVSMSGASSMHRPPLGQEFELPRELANARAVRKGQLASACDVLGRGYTAVMGGLRRAYEALVGCWYKRV